MFAMLGSAQVLAQLNNGQENSVVTMHVQAHNTKGINCNDSPEAKNIGCQDYVDEWDVGVGADVFMIIAEADSLKGISGVSLGVTYGDTPGVQTDGVGVDVFGYTFCSDLEYTNGINSIVDPSTEFPSASGGNRLIWVRTTNCQRHVIPPHKVHATACVFYVYAYSPDVMAVDMNRNLETPDEFQIVDCPGPALSDLSYPDAAGKVAFGIPGGGRNPCTDPSVAAKNTTWGKLKNQYR
jgi:hypothetical protein